MATLKYVDAEELMSPFEKKLHTYNKTVENFKVHDKIASLNWKLNEKTRSDSHLQLLTPDNMELMRFCYFENFEPDLTKLRKILETHQPSYVRVIGLHEQTASNCVQVAKNGKSRRQKTTNHLSLSAGPIAQSDTCIASVLRLPVFWSDVYHDIKYELSSTDFYDWLPAQKVAQNLIIELAELALVKLHWFLCTVLTQESMKMNADELHELGKNFSFYFGDNALADLSHLREELMGSFAQHMKLHIPVSQDDLSQLLGLLLSCVCDNLRIQYYGRNKGEQLVLLFGEFLAAIAETLWEVPSGSRSRLPSTSSIESESSSVFDLAQSFSLSVSPVPVVVQEEKPKKKKGFFRRFK